MGKLWKNCDACRHLRFKKKLFGERKYLCELTGQEVACSSVCSDFCADLNKLSSIIRFRYAQRPKEHCLQCVFFEGVQENGELVYYCRQIEQPFSKSISSAAEDYVCDYFGYDEDALFARFAEIEKWGER